MDVVLCPVCHRDHMTMTVYPNSICNPCVVFHKPRTQDGHYISFRKFNKMLQLFVNGERKKDSLCFVNYVKCVASLNKYGAVVIQKVGN